MRSIGVTAVASQRTAKPTLLKAALLPSLFAGLIGLTGPIGFAGPAAAQSQLLESVKQNPGLAKALCGQLQSFNAQGLSATSPAVVGQVARQENLSPMDSEVLITYVIGLYCPDVR